MQLKGKFRTFLFIILIFPYMVNNLFAIEDEYIANSSEISTTGKYTNHLNYFKHVINKKNTNETIIHRKNYNNLSTTLLLDIFNEENYQLVSSTPFNHQINIKQEQKRQEITLQSPNGGETWRIGTNKLVTWNSSDIDFVDIDASTNGGASWRNVATHVDADAGQYLWSITSSTFDPSTNSLVRVTEYNGQISDESDQSFTLSKLEVNTPNSGSKWQIGKTYDITWEASDDIDSVEIHYRKSPQVDWEVISTSVLAADESYNWLVPENQDLPTSQMQIRIRDKNPQTQDENTVISDQFNIAYLELLSPVGGEDYFSGREVSVEWDSDNISNVNLEYSTDNGITWKSISDSPVPANNNSYTWSIPYEPSDEARVRVSDELVPNVNSQSPNTFVISTIRVDVPNGAESFKSDGTVPIQWTSNVNSNVRIEISTDNGDNWSEVTSSISSSMGSYNYNISDELSNTNEGLVRIVNNSDSSEADTSNAVFTIGDLEIQSPSGGENLQAGTNYEIQWNASFNLGALRIQYSTDGANWNLITPSTFAQEGSYTWSIPSNFSANTVYIRLTDASDQITNYEITSVSDPFAISNLTLIQPNGNEAWESGTTQNIRWTSNEVITNITIEYSTDNGANWDNIIATGVDASQGIYNWDLNPTLTSSDMLVRITAENDPSFQSTSSTTFKVGDVILNQPSGGELFFSGSTVPIEWDATSNIDRVRLQYSTDGGNNFRNIANSVNALNGSYDWTIPNDISTDYGLVRISDTYGPNIDDTTSSTFSIANLRVLSPNGGEGFQINSNQTIRWNASNVDSVIVGYTLDNGNTWNDFSGVIVADQGQINWNVPDNVTSQARIRVKDADNPNFSDQSDNIFKIGSIEVLSPNGGQHYQTGAQKNIEWQSSSNIPNVSIQLSSNGGGSWITLESSFNADEIYDWTVNNAPTKNALVRVSDRDYPDIRDVSDSAFVIEYLSLNQPNGGEFLLADSSYYITWDANSVDNVTLEYTKNDGDDWANIVENLPAGSQPFEWTVPNDPGRNVILRIKDSDYQQIEDNSDETFIINQILVTSPNGGESYAVNSTQTVSWVSHSSVNNVNIYYSQNNGGNWNPIEENYNAASEIYQWNIPNSISNNYKIKIENAENTNVYDESNDVFSVGSMNVLSPNGGEKYQLGEDITIQWNNIPSVSLVDIEFSTDDGESWEAIANSVSATAESYVWSATDTNKVTAEGLIKISDASNPDISDVSDNNFTIASIEVTYPNGAERIQIGDEIKIKWNVENISTVDLRFSSDNGNSWNQIANGINAGLGEYNWNTVNYDPTSTALIRVRDAQVNNIIDNSDDSFNLILLDLTSPVENEGWKIGTKDTIQWDNNGVNNVHIEYTTNDGDSWEDIVTNYDADLEEFEWVTDNVNSNEVVIRITDVSDSDIFTESDQFIIGNVTLNRPSSNTVWKTGTTENIEWSVTSGIDYIDLFYSTDGGSNWTKINGEAVAANLNSYAWSIPGNVFSSNSKIKIAHANNNSKIIDVSDNFNINALNLTSPSGGDFLQAGTTANIEWTSSSVSNVKIEYRTDPDDGWQTITNSHPASNNFYPWDIDDNLSSDEASIRISDVSNPDIVDSNSSTFRIGWININSPQTTTVWQSDTKRNISWESSNSVNFVRIEYSLNGGSTWNTLESQYNADDSPYNWSIPNNTSSNDVKIRVSDSESNLEIADESPSFKIEHLDLTSPTGGELWQIDKSQTITWQASDFIQFIDIEFSSNNGSNWNQIGDDIPASNNPFDYTFTQNDITTEALIRIRNANNDSVLSVSNDNFTIGDIQLEEEFAGNEYQAGESIEITWNFENVTEVRISYSSDGGTNWWEIETLNLEKVESYIWQTPTNVNSDQMLIKIEAVKNPDVYDVSQSFTLKYIDLTYPDNENIVFQNGNQATITWNSGQINIVNLDYSTDGGNSWEDIVDNYPANNSSYDWSIPNNILTDEALVRILDSDNNAIRDSSSAFFRIGNIALTSPNTNDQWQAGKTHKITWSNDGIENVQLRYSLDNGNTWTQIVDQVAGDLEEYDWSIDNNIASNQAKIQILSSTDSDIKDISGLFKIKILSLQQPNGGEIWQAGSQKQITWTSDYIDSVDIDYSDDNGINWSNLTSNIDASSGKYDWKISQNIATSNALIRIIDSKNSSVRDSSNNVFAIGSLELTYPVGGEELQAGTQRNISWNSQNIQNITIEYSLDNGSTWNTVVNSVAGNLGNYQWSIPDNINSNQTKIKIKSTSNPSIEFISGLFTIKSLVVDQPNGGELWQAGTQRQIIWTSKYIDSVDLFFSDDGGSNWKLIERDNDASSGTYNWTIGQNINTNNALVRIIDSENNSIRDSSDSEFTIGNLELTFPTAGDVLQASSQERITWNSAGIENIKIEFSNDNGNSWQQLTSSIAGDLGGYDWSISKSDTTIEGKIRISDADNPSVSFTSGIFEIRLLSLINPNGGEIWGAGSQQKIEWNSAFVNKISLSYSTDAGSSWNLIANNINGNQDEYLWKIDSNLTSNTAKVRIIDEQSSEIRDSSENNFTIGNLALLSPSGGEEWQAGSVHPIRWNAQNLNSVDIHYSTDNGNTWKLIIDNFDATNKAQYNWTLPDSFEVASDLAKVKVVASSDTAISMISNFFTINYLKVTKPNNQNAILNAGSDFNIEWESAFINNINIEYSSNNGAAWNQIASNVNAQNGNHVWSIPENYSTTNGLIRVIYSNDPNVNDRSDFNFSIGNLQITQPTSGEVWQTESSQVIKWDASNINLVDLFYSTDNGNTWELIIEDFNAETNSQYSWNVPQGAYSDNAIIKVSSSNYSSMADSSGTFTIKQLNLLAPNASVLMQSGGSFDIRWENQFVDKVSLYYSLDNGSSWNKIDDDINADLNTYTWNIDSSITTEKGLVRIIDSDDQNVLDRSDQNFEIGQLELTQPLAGSEIQSGSELDINWSTTLIGNVTLEYTTNNGQSWNQINGVIPASEETYPWQIPEGIGTNTARIRIISSTNNDVKDSTKLFIIKHLVVTNPNTNVQWTSGTTRPINWNSIQVSNVDILFSPDDGGTWDTLKTQHPANQNPYDWNIPGTFTTNQGRIRIIDSDNSNISDLSDRTFSITSLNLTNINQGQRFQLGRNYDINWLAGPSIDRISLRIYTDGGINPVETFTLNAEDSSFNWEISEDQYNTSDQVVIRISDLPNENYTDEVSNLEIVNLELTFPDNQEYLQAGTRGTITWKSEFVNKVDIYYSLDNGNTYNQLSDDFTASNEGFNWDVNPNICTDELKVRLIDNRDTTIFTESNTTSRIGNVELIAPNGNELLNAGTSYDIEWDACSSINEVNVEYSTNNGSSWNPIALNLEASIGSQAWNIPQNLLSDSVVVRVSDAESENQIADISDDMLTITALNLVSPNGGEQIQVGENYAIQWEAVQSVQNLKIEYYTDNTGWRLIEGSADASAGSYNWTVPNLAAANCVTLRISDAANLSLSDTTEDCFRVANVNLTYPDGNEKLQLGRSDTIKWNNTANVEQVDIFYQIADGTPELINTDGSIDASQSSFLWKPEGVAPSNQARIKIIDVTTTNTTTNKNIGSNEKLGDKALNEISDSSNNYFTLTKLNFTRPDSSSNWLALSNEDIQWESDFVDTLILQYRNENDNWITSATGLDASVNSYNWSIPNEAISNNAQLKLYDKANPNRVYALSDEFIISEKSIEVVSPNGGEYWQTGEQHTIEWNAEGNVNNVSIFISSDDGATWDTLTAGISNSGSYNWLIPTGFNCSSEMLIKVEDVQDSFISDVSNSPFTVEGINLVSPVEESSITVQAGSGFEIEWESCSAGNNILIEFSENGVDGWSTIYSGSNDGPNGNFTYTWDVPNISTSNGRLRISIVGSSGAIVSESGDITIKRLSLVSPNGGENIQTGKPYQIEWENGDNIENIRIYYASDGTNFNTQITPSGGVSVTGGTNTYEWTPTGGMCSTDGKIRIVDGNNADILDESNTVFDVKQLDIVVPGGGENWIIGTEQTIEWNHCNVDNIRLRYSTNGGESWEPAIASNFDVSGGVESYDWTIPNTPTEDAVIGIYDEADDSIYSISGVFTIGDASLTLNIPNGGENYQKGETYTIEWSSTGSVGNVDILLSTDNGGAYSDTIAMNEANDGSYEWTVGSDIACSDRARVRVRDSRNTFIRDASDNPFTISDIQLISPAENTTLTVQAGGSYDIEWTSCDTTGNVLIEFSPDGTFGGNTTTQTVGITGPNDDYTYTWDVPNISTSNGRLRISIVGSSGAIVSESGDITIKRLSLVSPNGGENIQTGKPYQIEWENGDNIENIRIYYASDGTNFNTQITPSGGVSVTGGTNTYEWTPTGGMCSTDGKIRIVDGNNADILDESNTVFDVKQLDIVVPGGGENWIIGTEHTIEWNFCNVDNMGIRYSTDGGSSWSNGTIYSNLDLTGGLQDTSWIIPDNPTGQAVVQIYDIADDSIYSTSQTFNIIDPQLSLSYPTGGEHFLNDGNLKIPVSWESDLVTDLRMRILLIDGNSRIDSITVTDQVNGEKQYNFPIGDDVETDQAKFELYYVNQSHIRDSSGNFTISQMDITSPETGDYLQVGRGYTISWDRSDFIDKVELSISTNGTDGPFTNISLPDNTADSVNWTPSSSFITDNAVLKVAAKNHSDSIFVLSGELKIRELDLFQLDDNHFQAGRQIPFEFEYSSNISSVDIRLKNKDSDVIGAPISPTLSGSPHSTNITPPNNVNSCSDSVFVVIRDSESNQVIDSSNAFQISYLKITSPSPNSTTNWEAGKPQTIQWEYCGDLSNVNIYYTLNANNPSSWDIVSNENTEATNLDVTTTDEFQWQLDETLNSPNAQIMIEDAANSGIIAYSNIFNIYQDDLTLTSPGGNECINAGEQLEITWDGPYTDAIKIEYSTDGGNNPNTISPNVPATADSYIWNIPSSLSSAEVVIKITELSDTTNFDISNEFTIGSIELVYPVAGDYLRAGDPVNIQFTKSSSVNNVIMYWTTADSPTDSDWNTFADVPASDTNFVWNIPNIESENLKLKLCSKDCGECGISYVSGNIGVEKLDLTSPDGGEYWQTGPNYTHTIDWDASDFVETIEITIYEMIDGALEPIDEITIQPQDANTSPLSITVPESVITDSAFVVINDLLHSSVADTSRLPFTIGQLSCTVFNQPDEKILKGNCVDITWNTSDNVENIKLEYSTNGLTGTWKLVNGWVASDGCNNGDSSPADNVPADVGIYHWDTDDVSPSNNCYIRITATGTGAGSDPFSDTNDEPFTVADLQFTSFNGGEHGQIGVSDAQANANGINAIKGNAEFINEVIVEYSTDNGNNWESINQTNTASQTVVTSSNNYDIFWQLNTSEWDENDAGSNYIIRVSDVDYYDKIYKVSQSTNSLYYVEVVKPNGGSGRKIGSKIDIEAEIRNLQKVDIYIIDYSTDSPTSYLLLKDETTILDNISQYLGIDLIGIAPTDRAKVRIVDPNHNTIYDESDDFFTINTIDVTSPEPGDKFQILYPENQHTQNYSVEWETEFIDELKFELQGSFTMNPVAGIPASVSASQGSVNWDIYSNDNYLPQLNSTLRVYDPNDSSNAEYSIDSLNFVSLYINKPDSRVAWEAGSSGNEIDIYYKYIDSVRIFLEIPNQGTYPLTGVDGIKLPSSSSGSTLDSYTFSSFTVPSNISSDNVYILVEDVSDRNIFDKTDTALVIGNRPDVTAGASCFGDEMEMLLGFSSPGELLNLAQVRISTDGGVTYPYIITESYWNAAYDNIGSSPSHYVDFPIRFKTKQILDEFNGDVDVELTFNSSYGVEYVNTITDVCLDNKAPSMEFESIGFDPNPNVYGWDETKMYWSPATDYTGKINYEVSWNYADGTTKTFVTNHTADLDSNNNHFVIIDALVSGTEYTEDTLLVSDGYGNFVTHTFDYTTLVAGDFYYTEVTGSGKQRDIINDNDLVEFITSWTNDSIGADLYPYEDEDSVFPSTRIIGDLDFNMDDVLYFTDLWYYQVSEKNGQPLLPKSGSNNLPKQSFGDFNLSGNYERIEKNIKDGENRLTLPLNISNKDIAVYSTKFYYNSNTIDIDSMNVRDKDNSVNLITLSHIDSVNGVIRVNIASLSGKINSDFDIELEMDARLDRFENKDSLIYSYRGYNLDKSIVEEGQKVYSMTQLPTNYKLYQNYPNPFNPETTIEYDLPKKSNVTLTIYNILGQKVKTLVNEVQKPGYYSVNFNALSHRLASGVYLYRLRTEQYSTTKKMLLIK